LFPGISVPGNFLFLRIGERPLTHSLERGIIMGEPYECMEGMCQDVVSWSLSGVLAAAGIVIITVFIVTVIIGEIRRK
jgi:hypothetical protein